MFSKSRRKNRTSPEEEIETVIGPTATFRGSIRSRGSICIEGVFEGAIETTGKLIIGDEAKILADIVANNIPATDTV